MMKIYKIAKQKKNFVNHFFRKGYNSKYIKSIYSLLAKQTNQKPKLKQI